MECEICKKREATFEVKVCDNCHNDLIMLSIEAGKVKNEKCID